MTFRASAAAKSAAESRITESDRVSAEIVYNELRALKSALDVAELRVAQSLEFPDVAVAARAKYDAFFNQMIAGSSNPVIIADINS